MELTRGERLADLRKSEDLTVEQLAKIVGVSNGTISNIENDKSTNIKVDCIIALAKHFNVTSDYLLGLSDYKTPQAADIGAITGLSDDNIDLFKNILYKDKEKIKYYLKDQARTMETAEYFFNNFYNETNMKVFNDVIDGLHYYRIIDKLCELKVEVNLSKAFINDIFAGNSPAWDFRKHEPVDDYAYAFIAKDIVSNYLTDVSNIFMEFIKKYIDFDGVGELYNTLIDKWREIHPPEIPVGTPEKPFDKISSFIREKEGDT